MAWWQILDNPNLYTTSGVLLFALVIMLVLTAGGLGIAYLWHAWRDTKT